VIKFINSDELSKEVEAMAADVRAKGITGVPMTIIDSKWAVGGGQSSDVYVQVSITVLFASFAYTLADFQEAGALRSCLLHSSSPFYQHHDLPVTGGQQTRRLHLIIACIWMLRCRFFILFSARPSFVLLHPSFNDSSYIFLSVPSVLL